MFKIGDKVRVKKDIDLSDEYYDNRMKITIGEIGIVKDVGNGSIRVDFPDPIKDYWHYKESDLELTPFTKSDLRDTDIVTLKNGEVKVWEKWKNGLAYKQDLKAPTDYRRYDIMKVERPTELETVFEREEKVKVSIEDLVKCYEKVNKVKVEV